MVTTAVEIYAWYLVAEVWRLKHWKVTVESGQAKIGALSFVIKFDCHSKSFPARVETVVPAKLLETVVAQIHLILAGHRIEPAAVVVTDSAPLISRTYSTIDQGLMQYMADQRPHEN